MKKLVYLLLILPFAFVAACDDDDDLPEVEITYTMSNVTQVDNSFYAIKGDTAIIDNLTVKSLNGNSATVTGVRYYLDYLPIISNPVVTPFSTWFETEDLPAKKYNIGITATILQVDKSISNAAMNVPFILVENKDKLPANAPEIGTYSLTMKTVPEKN
ncbi:MAG: hypothetical protein K1W02_16320 [Muribaculaceae bacterium]